MNAGCEPRRPHAAPASGPVLADPGPLPAEITAPRFLAALAASRLAHGWHAVEDDGGLQDRYGYHSAGCGEIVQIARADLQPYRPGEPPVSHDPCPGCRWEVAARTGTLHVALDELADPLAHDVAAAILNEACRATLDDDEATLDSPRMLQLLAHVSRHEPVSLVSEECAEGSCSHPEGQCPGGDACQACSLQAAGWGGEWEGTFLEECTIPAPCAPLLAVAAHFGVEIPAGDGAARIAAERRSEADAEVRAPASAADRGDGRLALAAACYAMPPQHRHISAMDGSPLDWPWHADWWKPGDRARELEKAGALIAAELDRLTAAAPEVPGA